LTICTVVYGDVPFLEAHRSLAARLNPDRQLDWLVVANQPAPPFELEPVPHATTRVIEGAEPPGDPDGGKRHRSWHHAAGLALATPHLHTRFVLVCDADCFLVRPGWADDVVAHMTERGLAFFGVPYHPRLPIKMRGVPCAVALFIDTELVDLAALDWTPKAAASTPLRRPHSLTARALTLLGEEERLTIGTSEDTGVTVYRRARAEGQLRSEAVTPVLLPHQLPKTLRRPRSLVLDRLLPDRYAFVPKADGAWAEQGTDPALANFEEYVWRGAPFAFHLRPTLKGADRADVDLPALLARFG
jgi:hypothetical protein